ncbi:MULTISPECIES: proline-rich domain-containing protein [Kitasatospora]|uniref:Uncharacterized protein n=1 Tax=Kitasatospora setae (strain ATCC 33774 / DSM 43861 / JCM 3304 / KCC A-0304 / NBRC 14216 / KM-6054) TaxID=452652 RepID=E4NBV2_KITSK|nr:MULTISPECIES: proline-rich domain-containing protein [Kitasatospora]BAJ28683.1 hypothetical protein KSE_28720 [Kitasatospora setae KM-6054]
MTHPPQPGAPAPEQPEQPGAAVARPEQAQQPSEQPHEPPSGQPHEPPSGPPLLPEQRSAQQPYPQQQQQQPQQPWGAQAYPAPPPNPYAYPWGAPPPPPPRRLASRVLAVLALVGLALVLLVAVGGTVYLQLDKEQKPTTPAYVAEQRAWSKVAQGLTDALAAKDEEAFVRPFAAGPAKEKQRLVFRNLLKVPWETARWEVSTSSFEGRLRVDFVHQVKGVDNFPVTEEYGWQVRPVDSGTEVVTEVGAVKDHTGKSDDGGYYPAPWDLYDELAVRSLDHLVVMADKSQSVELDRDADLLARAAADDLAAWHQFAPAPVGGRGGAQGFFVVLERNREVYNKLYQGDGKQDDSLEAGVNMPVPAADGVDRHGATGLLVGGSRIVMDTTDSRFTDGGWKDGVTDIGRHEMAHALVATLLSEHPSASGKGQPHDWVAEGFAEFMALRGKDSLAGDELDGTLSEVAFDGKLPGEGGEFYADTIESRAANYVLSGDAVRYLAATYGEAKAFGFVAAHYAKPSGYEQQITAATGQSPEAFQSAWAAHVRSEAGRKH